ncbi:unnamed protein product [Litomosoides sigmodontis]|uniref:Protein kinase domain-containing protein n=1 Tax=Litomosoides sigmodontis TaxID=42156 RepID=A0A3P6U5G5_LITSI|nr:unnamed protein product [Litomosoides sigmodontis]
MSATRVVKQIAEGIGKSETSRVELVMENLHLFSNGIFSNVYKGLLKKPQRRLIAIKKSWSDQSNYQPTEVQILTMLNRLHHKNIIKLLYKFSQAYPDQKICTALVFEFFPMNLHEVREKYGPLSILDIKLYIWQLFRGQAHLEKNNVCHRDIKPQNLLIDHENGMLKISDFGSSKLIMNVLGYPSPRDIATMRVTTNVLQSNYFHDDIMKKPNPDGLKKLIKLADQNALKLLAEVLVYDPASRLSGPRFLAQSYFSDLFNPQTRRNGQRIKILTKEDLERAAAGDEELSDSVATDIHEM